MPPGTVPSDPDTGISSHAVLQRFDGHAAFKQSSVTLNFTTEKSPPAMRPLVLFDHLLQIHKILRKEVQHHWPSVIGTLQFLANVNSRSRSLYAIARPSVVCLSSVCRL